MLHKWKKNPNCCFESHSPLSILGFQTHHAFLPPSHCAFILFISQLRSLFPLSRLCFNLLFSVSINLILSQSPYSIPLPVQLPRILWSFVVGLLRDRLSWWWWLTPRHWFALLALFCHLIGILKVVYLQYWGGWLCWYCCYNKFECFFLCYYSAVLVCFYNL